MSRSMDPTENSLVLILQFHSGQMCVICCFSLSYRNHPVYLWIRECRLHQRCDFNISPRALGSNQETSEVKIATGRHIYKLQISKK